MKATLPEPSQPAAKALDTSNGSTALRAFYPFGASLALLSLAFSPALLEWFNFSRRSDLFSYAVLIPFVSAYLGWITIKAGALETRVSSSLPWAALSLTLGILALAASWSGVVAVEDRLCVRLLAFVLFVAAAGFLTLGSYAMRKLAFPFAFLLFMVPLPKAFVDALEVFFQHGSADTASLMIQLSGLPVIRDGLFFRLPGLLIQVAQECSGIRSTLVLFITSLVAGRLFLRTNWRRAAIAAFVVPLAMLRNGFRIFTLAYLTVEVDPRIIDSPLHHRGGPIFFALSLVPFVLCLWLLRRNERARASK